MNIIFFVSVISINIDSPNTVRQIIYRTDSQSTNDKYINPQNCNDENLFSLINSCIPNISIRHAVIKCASLLISSMSCKKVSTDIIKSVKKIYVLLNFTLHALAIKYNEYAAFGMFKTTSSTSFNSTFIICMPFSAPSKAGDCLFCVQVKTGKNS